MSNFYVTFDQKVTVWVRNVVTVNAKSQQEAIEKVGKAIEHSDYADVDEDITYEESSELVETEQPMSIKDNAGCATVEILDPKSKEVIWDNVDKYNVNSNY